MKKAFIIGAGPAGLTAAYELLKQSDEYELTVFEESFHMGGISKTVNYKGNRMDMGGHRFFSKVPEVNAWWEQMLPMQGAPAADDIMLQRDVPLEKGGPDPQKEDRVMLNRNRVSRIYFDQKFYDYPIQLKPELFMNMGFLQTMQVGFSYLASLIHKRPENSLEDFYINRFGKKLYSMFFEHYTENLWGRHPRDIDPSWGAQRVKGLSIIAILKDILWKIVPTKKAHQVETSLIESFRYPKLGPGELWDVTASEIEKLGGKILKGCKVVGLEKDANDHIVALTYEQDGKKIRLSQPQQMMAQDRKIVDEAYAGDIIGLFDPGIFSIGDTVCMAGHKIQYEGIPTFAPEHFARVRQVDTMKRKQFVKGIEQIAQEGAIQIFQEYNTGMEEIIVGVVGVLQFDVLKYRLNNEYNVEIRLENLPYEHIRWIENREIDLDKISGTSDMKKIKDLKGRPLLLWVNSWSIGMTMDRNPGLELSEFGR